MEPLPQSQCLHFGEPSGASRIRTGDLLLAKQALCQLSYGPSQASLGGERGRLPGSADYGALVAVHRETAKTTATPMTRRPRPDVVAGWGAEQEGAHRVDRDREGVDFGEGLQGAGIESTGTKAEEMKVSGKMMMNRNACEDSGEDETSPTKAKTQEKA